MGWHDNANQTNTRYNNCITYNSGGAVTVIGSQTGLFCEKGLLLMMQHSKGLSIQ